MPPAPKPTALRQRRNRTTTAATLEAPPAKKVDLPQRFASWKCARKGCSLSPAKHDRDGFVEADIMPHDFRQAVVPWHTMTASWWDTIWESPMVAEWVQADVPGLLVLAVLVDDFWRTGDPRIAAEIRLQQREYGLSSLSRRTLQWEIKRLEAASKPATPPPATRRRRGKTILRALSA